MGPLARLVAPLLAKARKQRAGASSSKAGVSSKAGASSSRSSRLGVATRAGRKVATRVGRKVDGKTGKEAGRRVSRLGAIGRRVESRRKAIGRREIDRKVVGKAAGSRATRKSRNKRLQGRH